MYWLVNVVMLAELLQEIVQLSQDKQFVAFVCKSLNFQSNQIDIIKKLSKNVSISIDQQTCSGTTDNNNTYFVNPTYPGSWAGGLGYLNCFEFLIYIALFCTTIFIFIDVQ